MTIDALLLRAQAGDADAIAQVVTENRGLILHVRARYARSLDIDDAIQVGSIGLMTAIRRYDPARGAWSTLACIWIRQALTRELRRDHVIRHPYHEEYGNAPKVGGLGAAAEPVARYAGPLAAAIAAEEVADILARVADLEPRMATVIRKRFGLDGGEPMLLIDIGAEMGITRERVRQLQRDALETLAGKVPALRRQYARRKSVAV